MDGRNIPSEYGWFAKNCFSNISWFPSQEQPFQTWTALSLGGVLAVVFTMFLIIQKRPSTMDALYNLDWLQGKSGKILTGNPWVFTIKYGGFRLKFSHHPVLWPLQFGSFLGSLFDSTVADPWEIGLQYPKKTGGWPGILTAPQFYWFLCSFLNISAMLVQPKFIFRSKFGSFETCLISIFHSTEWSSHLDSDTLW